MTTNYYAVLVSALASMAIGSIWFGPLFGKLYIHEQGWDKRSPEERKAMMKNMHWTYAGQFVASVVMFYVLSVIVNATGITGALGGMEVALMLWIGFIVTTAFTNVLWSEGKRTLFWLNIGSMLLTLLAAGAIIGAWR
jgi:hypothetical protein